MSGFEKHSGGSAVSLTVLGRLLSPIAAAAYTQGAAGTFLPWLRVHRQKEERVAKSCCGSSRPPLHPTAPFFHLWEAHPLPSSSGTLLTRTVGLHSK